MPELPQEVVPEKETPMAAPPEIETPSTKGIIHPIMHSFIYLINAYLCMVLVSWGNDTQ